MAEREGFHGGLKSAPEHHPASLRRRSTTRGDDRDTRGRRNELRLRVSNGRGD
jgi:hypothetical protein